jgi:hypothetical protein
MAAMGFMDEAKKLLDEHDEQVDQALEKAGEVAKERFAGHEEQIDQGVDRLQQMTGAGDTTQQAAPPPEQPPEGEQPPPR